MIDDLVTAPLINLLRLHRIANPCPMCHKLRYGSRADAQSVADLTYACDGQEMEVYPVHRGWHLRSLTKQQQRRRQLLNWRLHQALKTLIERRTVCPPSLSHGGSCSSTPSVSASAPK